MKKFIFKNTLIFIIVFSLLTYYFTFYTAADELPLNDTEIPVEDLTASSSAITYDVEQINKEEEVKESLSSMSLSETDWGLFRKNSNNIAVVNYRTPGVYEKTKINWKTDISSQTGASHTSVAGPVILGDNIYVSSNDMLFKIDRLNGNIAASAKLSASIGYQYFLSSDGNNIYVQLKNGEIEAYEKESLSRLWTSQAPSSGANGQGLCPVYVTDEFLYSGTVVTSGANGVFYCIDKNGNTVWEFSPAEGGRFSGFYWSGAVAVSDFIIFGSEGGIVYSLNRFNGELLDTFNAVGDIRSSVSYANDSLYFSTKKGYIYKLKLNADGSFGKSCSALISDSVLESTSTPAVYGGRVYVGAKTKNGGGLGVLNADNLEQIYFAEVGSNIQTTPLISCYNDNIFIYACLNKAPGEIYAFKDSKNQKQPLFSSIFSPEGKFSQYCINSLTTDESGAIYYINDSTLLASISGTGEEALPENGGSSSNEILDERINISINFSLLGANSDIWLNLTLDVLKNSTVKDIILNVFDKNNYSCVGIENNYISSVITPDGKELSEFDYGINSGWLYSVNGKIPNASIENYTVFSGDSVKLFYTSDYLVENSSGYEASQDSALNTLTSSSEYKNAVLFNINNFINTFTNILCMPTIKATYTKSMIKDKFIFLLYHTSKFQALPQSPFYYAGSALYPYAISWFLID